MNVIFIQIQKIQSTLTEPESFTGILEKRLE